MSCLDDWRLTNEPEIQTSFDLHKAWVWLTKSGALREEPTFAELSEAFDTIQKDFSKSADFSFWHRRTGGRGTCEAR